MADRKGSTNATATSYHDAAHMVDDRLAQAIGMVNTLRKMEEKAIAEAAEGHDEDRANALWGIQKLLEQALTGRDLEIKLKEAA